MEREETLLPPFNLEWAKYAVRTRGNAYLRSMFDAMPDVHSLERVHDLVGSSQPVFYVFGPHRTQFDYFAPTWTLVNHDLPYARIITGQNLASPLVRCMGFDLPQFGVIWKKRGELGFNDAKDYYNAQVHTIQAGLSIGGWPEGADKDGARDRLRELRVRDFPSAYFSPALRVRDKINAPLPVVCISFNYDKRPEERFFEKMDNTRLGKFGYHAWGLISDLNWRFFERNRGILRVNISEPIDICALAGSGSRNERADRVAMNTKKIIEDLLAEIK